MTKRRPKTTWPQSFSRILAKMTKAASRTGSKAIGKALKTPRAQKKVAANPGPRPATWNTGVAAGMGGARRYYLYKPLGVRRTERLPLMVMLHGCGQDAHGLAESSKMNKLAEAKRFLVLYPEQDRLANAQGCWNWFATRSGRAQREADLIDAVISQACVLYPVDERRIVIAGLSAGASMAALLATRRPNRFRAIAMHSGVAPGVAHSSAGAITAMRGHKVAGLPLPAGIKLPPLLVIHGSQDRVVERRNGAQAARLWADQCGATPGAPRTVRRGARYPATIVDYRAGGHLVASACEITGLGHAWSGGAVGRRFSDSQGPDASAMIWNFAKRQFVT